MPAPSSLKDGTLTIRDGSTPANELVVPFVRAGFSAEGKRTLVKVRNRDQTIGFIEPLDPDYEGELELTWLYDLAFGSDDPSLREVVNREGRAAAWASTAPAGYAYALDWEFRVAIPGGNRDEVHLFAGVVVSNERQWNETDGENTTSFPFMAASHSASVDS